MEWKNKNSVSDEDTPGCFTRPVNVNSFGVWAKNRKKNVLDYPLPFLEMLMIVILFIWQFIHSILGPLGFIKFTSQMIAGVLLSKTVIRRESPLGKLLFPVDDKINLINTMGLFGYTMFWFLMGVKMDVGMVFRTGKRATVIGLISVFAPLAACAAFYPKKLSTSVAGDITSDLNAETTTVMGTQSITTFPVIANLLVELGMENSELGRLGMSSALVSDLVSNIFSVIISIWNDWNLVGDRTDALMSIMGFIIFLVFTVFVFRPRMFWVIRKTPEGKTIKDSYIYAIFIVVLLSGVYADKNNLFLPLGPYILGLAVPHGPPLASALVLRFENFVSGAFLPFFVATCTMKMTRPMPYKVLKKVTSNLENLSIILLTFVVKFAASVITALSARMPLRDSLALALVMSHKGIVELGSYTIAYEKEILRPITFSIGVACILINSAIVPLLLRAIYDPSRRYAGYRKRNMVYLNPDSELKILSCIHKPDNIIPMMNLLELSCSPTESPVAAYLLHLIELIGQAHPLFISHKMQTRRIGNHSYSENIIISFRQFERKRSGLESLDIFTSVSAPKGMYEDVCTLALDKSTSLILLPFHRTWSLDGSFLTSDNQMIRSVNLKILESAPCSVGILVDRSRIGRKTIGEAELAAGWSPSYQICMVFIGGPDDVEALRVAKRMAKDTRVNLTVVRFIGAGRNYHSGVNEDKVLEAAGLKDVKENNVGECFVIYIEQIVKDGIETALVLRSMVDEYDLFVVGQRRGNSYKSLLTKGLEQWSEFEELGIVGDLLASQDLDSRASILVVQQQKDMAF